MEPKIQEFNNCLESWQHRKLTLMGKITVLKSFALPKLVYPLSVLPNPPEEQIKYIINKMYQFLWDGKPDKVKRNIIIQNYRNGGLKMVDLRYFMNALKGSWIKRILNVENKGVWKQIYLNKLKKYGGNMLFECNINKNDIHKLFPEKFFFQYVLLAWQEIKQNKEHDCLSQE